MKLKSNQPRATAEQVIQTSSTAAFNWLGLLYRYAAVVLMCPTSACVRQIGVLD